MFKKLFKIGMLVSLLSVACMASAQEQKNYELEYPHYGFWSNWSLGVAPSWSWQAQFQDHNYNGFGLMLFAEKEMNYKWYARFSVFGPLSINWAFRKFADAQGL